MSVVIREVSRIGMLFFGEYHCLFIAMHSYEQ